MFVWDEEFMLRIDLSWVSIILPASTNLQNSHGLLSWKPHTFAFLYGAQRRHAHPADRCGEISVASYVSFGDLAAALLLHVACD